MTSAALADWRKVRDKGYSTTFGGRIGRWTLVLAVTHMSDPIIALSTRLTADYQ